MNAFSTLSMALAAQGAQVSLVPGAAPKQTKRSRVFAETIASDVYEHLHTKPEIKDKLDRLLNSSADADRKVKAVRPLVAQAAKSLFTVASSGDFKFETIFPASVLDAIAKHLVAQAS